MVSTTSAERCLSTASTAAARTHSVLHEEFHLSCTHCAKRCAVDATFCSGCGHKLKRNAFAELRTKLPSLDKYRPLASTSLHKKPIAMPMTMQAPQPRGDTQRQQRVKKKRPLPVRVAKLESRPEALVQTPSSPQRETMESDLQLELRLKIWMASTRRLVEQFLEAKRRIERLEGEPFDGSRLAGGVMIIHGLEVDLRQFDKFFSCDRNLQTKCTMMLEKVKDLYREITQRVPSPTRGKPDNAQPEARTPVEELHESATRISQVIRDAELVIRGPDGKRMYFKRHHSPTRPSNDSTFDLVQPNVTQVSAMVVPHTTPKAGKQIDPPAVLMPARRRMVDFMRSHFPWFLLFRVTRVDRRVVLLRVEENDDLHQLEVHLYRPLTSQAWVVNIPLEWLVFILPSSLTWYRASEIRRYKTIEAHWSQCFGLVQRCLKWKVLCLFAEERLYATSGLHHSIFHQHDTEVQVCFPVQYRQARVFSFRSFASFYGLVTVHLLLPDYSIKIVFINARTTQRVVLALEERQISRCLGLGTEFRERIVSYTTRRVLYAQVCDRLYFEYTSRGFELLFPGVKPKGALRRHPDEVSIVQHRTAELQQEREELHRVMSECIKQVAVLAQRRLELYHDRMRMLRKAKQEAAAKKIQVHTKGFVEKRRRRRERDEQRRASRVQDVAATLIQHQYRKQRDAERQRRLRAIQLQDQHGVRFRVCSRINNTYMMAVAALDEIDAASNAFDCNVTVVHPSTFQVATLRIAHSDILHMLGTVSLRGIPRREAVGALVREHLDVFRSTKHNVLVLALRSSSSTSVAI